MKIALWNNPGHNEIGRKS